MKRARDPPSAATAFAPWPAAATASGWSACDVSDCAGTVWPVRDRSFCLWDGESDLWTEELIARGWRHAGELCSPDDVGQLKEIVAGTRKPPAHARRRCLYLSIVPSEHNVLCRLPQPAPTAPDRWRLALFPGIEGACTKSATAAQMQALGSAHYPTTFTLPQDRAALQELAAAAAAAAAAASGADNEATAAAAAASLWIAKPGAAWGGSGIVVFDAASPEFGEFVRSERSAAAVAGGSAGGRVSGGAGGAGAAGAAVAAAAAQRQRGTVVQRYVHRAALIGGYKYHVRVYVLVTQLRATHGGPRAYLHTGGLVEFSTRPFTLRAASLGRRFDPLVHLTNTALTMAAGNMGAVLADKPGVGRGVAWTLGQWMDHLGGEAAEHAADCAEAAGLGGEAEEVGAAAAERRCAAIWAQIGSIAKETVAGIASHAAMQKGYPTVAGRHFNVLGLDVVLDADDRAWLCECNDTPGLDSWASWAATESAALTPEQSAALELGRLDGECRALINDTVELLGLDGADGRNGGDVSRFYRCF